jgi:hypothetical protein
MPVLRKLAFLLLAILLCLAYALFIKSYLISAALLIALILTFLFLQRLLTEELVIHRLYKHSFEMPYNQIIGAFPKTGKKAVERLLSKGIVQRSDDLVRLVIKNYRFSITKDRIHERA